jgi:hypothetical protein
LFETPKVESFSVSKKTVELTGQDLSLDFILQVSHPIGISSNKTNLWFKNRENNIQLSTSLERNYDAIGNRVTFTGSLELSRSIPPGIYDFYAEPIAGIPGRSLFVQPKTGNIYPEDFNLFPGAEKSVLVRLNGNLNLKSYTFVGPSYRSPVILTDDKPLVYIAREPIFKVGETYDPKKYFSVRVPGITLKIISESPSVCNENLDVLKFIATGTCNFTVFTQQNSDYLKTSISLSAQIGVERSRPSITLPIIAKQNISGLPKVITIGPVYNSLAEIIYPKSISPNVCFASSFSTVTIVGGGICELSYQTPESETALESDILIQVFEVTRDTQTIIFTPPATANISAKTLALSATASGGGVITYQTTSAGICSITGSTLNLLKGGNCSITATQAGTPTLAPISATATVMIAGSVAPTKKTIACVKGNKTKKISGTNPKCPKGYKVKR